MANESQEKILESLTIDDYKNIDLPVDDFFDDASSVSDEEDGNNENKRYRFGHDIYEKYSTYYFCETILGIKSEDAKYIGKININELTVYNRIFPWFDENLFYLLLDFCQNEKHNIIFDPDYIIKNINGDTLLNGIAKHKENIHCLRNWIDKNKSYDLIGEISLDYLSENRKVIQTLKYINIINLFHKIQNSKQINPEKKKKFEEKFGLVPENEKILIIMTDGNYEKYLNNLKDSKIFKEEKKVNNNIETALNNKLTISQQIINDIKNSGINFIIVYVPRAYVNIKTIYSDLDKFQKQVEELKKEITQLKEEKASLYSSKGEIKKSTDENVDIDYLREELLKLKNENKNLQIKLDDLTLKFDKFEPNK